jgi:hypothetical protein
MQPYRCINSTIIKRGRDSVANTATRNWLDGSEFDPGGGGGGAKNFMFPRASTRARGGPRNFPGGKAAGALSWPLATN